MSEEQKKVLALKYRPKRFEDLVGQSTISQTLSLALDSNRLSHAYLFSGLRGSGKTSTARIMAKALICDNGPTSKPCDVCQNCVSANTSRHLDIIEMDAASNRGIDDIKDLIEHTKYKPSSARFKVFIIDEVHMLTTQAFNALLKTLEEPPPFVKFILATTDPLKLPATILSRTQHFRFKRISNKDVIHHLSHILNIENIDFDTKALEVITRAGQGSLRDTLTLLDQAIIFSKGRVDLSSVTDMLGIVDPKILDELFDTLLAKKDYSKYLEIFEEYEASSVCDELISYLKQKMLEKDNRFSVILLDRLFRILSDAKYLLSINSDSTFVMILTFLKIQEATNLKTIDDIINEVESIETNDNVIVKKVVKEQIEIKEEIQKEIEKVEEPIVQTLQHSQEENASEEVIEEIIQVQEEPISIEDEYLKYYQAVTKNIYERDYELGECFEKNFIYENFENDTLYIKSFAKDKCKQMLWKYFSYIRGEIENVFGASTHIEFIKTSKEPEQKQQQPIVEEKKNLIIIPETKETFIPKEEYIPESNIGEIVLDTVEDEITSSGCVAGMIDGDKTKTTLSQKDIHINDILNSSMVNRAKELFDIKKIVVNSRT